MKLTDIQILYQHVGRAMHKAQLVEFNLATLWILLDRIEPSGVNLKKDEVWSKKTLGKLLFPVIKSDMINGDVRLFLETLLNARNHLAHAFFMSETSLIDADGVARLIREANAMINVFDRAIKLFDQVMKSLSKEVGIDYLQIKVESRRFVLSSHD